MADEPTLGEVQRRVEQGFIDLKDDMRELGARLDSKVDAQVYDLRHETLTQRVTTLETLREKDAEKIVATRRWLIGAVVVPLIGVLLPIVIMLTRGAGS
ncbi:hypothetical protein AB0E27_19970 [Streptomyces sparsogenes]|uniref:hypothetical protein n=1 Tax=Streptomyces sparsogenes TaxID=67365 RepID=UPI0033C8B5A3